jgi:hypothetical protein
MCAWISLHGAVQFAWVGLRWAAVQRYPWMRVGFACVGAFGDM